MAITGTAAVTSDMTINTTGLVADCNTLLDDVKDTLLGTATLSPDWAENVAMDTWDGVTVSGDPPRVTQLKFHRKGLTGMIPPALGDLSELTGLELHHSDLTGPIPEALGDLSNLETLDLHVNQLTGPIPTELGSLSKLTVLALDQNDLTGSIPTELGNLSNLQTLALNHNRLSGMIPEALGGLSNLTDLWLDENALTGPIPAAWGSATHPLSELQTLRLDNNQLSGDFGPIPVGTPGLRNLINLRLDNNALRGAIPPAWSTLSTLNLLRLTATDWTGTIPQALLEKQTAGTLTLRTNRRPIPPTVADQTPVVGARFAYSMAFSDPDGDTLHYLATQADGSDLPTWLTFDTETRLLSGTPSTTGEVTVTVTATDGDPLTATDFPCDPFAGVGDEAGLCADVTLELTITADLLEAPVITTTSPILVAENETAVVTLAATDEDTAGDDLTWSIPSGTAGGADAADFTLTSAGVLTFTTAKDYETPDDTDEDNIYEVTVQVSDGTNTATAALEVAVNNVIELTTLTGPAAVAYAENQAGRVATYSASSAADRDGIVWSLSGDDAAHFSLDEPGGTLRFHIDPVSPNRFPTPPDFEAPADADEDNAYAVTVQAATAGATPITTDVTVTVTDVDEAGTLALSSTRPQLGEELTATLTDADGVVGTPVYTWERSIRPNAWTDIAGATSSTYTPTAADTGRFLRATATYEDGHGTGQIATALTYEVVTASLLTGLQVTTNDAAANPSRALSPAFSADVLHYAVGCAGSGDTMTVTPTAASGVRLAVDGVQTTSGTGRAVTVNRESDVHITLTTADGAITTYVVHCLIGSLWAYEATKKPGATGILEEFILLLLDSHTVAMLDNNAVPRFHRNVGFQTWAHFRVERVPGADQQPGHDLEYRYWYVKNVLHANEFTVLDQSLEILDTGIKTVAPLDTTDQHDFRILPDGNYLLMAYEPADRDLSGLSFDHPDIKDSQPQAVRDAAVQIITPAGEAVFTWNSWGNMPLEDCTQEYFVVTEERDRSYAHINSLQMVDGLIIASFRGCSKVLAIDPDHDEAHKVAWRVGRSNLTAEQWAARDVGPAPMTLVGDPAGQFCGQHAAQILPSGNLILFDNGTACLMDPWTGEAVGRASAEYSRAVEYALDPDNGEAVFVRDHSLRRARQYVGYFHGQVEPLANGDWLVSWGRPHPRNATPGSLPVDVITQVDPDTGEEKFALRDPDNQRRHARAIPLHPVALFAEPEPLTAALPDSATSSFHTGATAAPTVVVAFNRPVVDFAATTPSVALTGATVASVAPRSEAGAPANAYLFTLTPDGDGPITFSLVANQSCATGGICTADGTGLSAVPAAQTIPGPVRVAFSQASVPVTEGGQATIIVTMQPAHGRPDALEIPLLVGAASTAADDDFSVPLSVTFGPTATTQTISFMAIDDTVAEAAETVALAFATLPAGVTAGDPATATVTIAANDPATMALTIDPLTVPEGGTAAVTLAITNGVTFATEQSFPLTFGGSAQAADYTVAANPMMLPAEASQAATTLTIADDAEEEAEESLIVSAAHAGTEPAGDPDPATLTIPANDTPAPVPAIAIWAGPSSPEGRAATFTLTRTGAPEVLAAALTVGVAVTESGAMLRGTPPTTVTFPPEAGSTSLAVATLDDRVIEAASTLTAMLTESAAAYTLDNEADEASITVTDNDVAEFTLTVTPATIAEGASAQVTVALTNNVTFTEDQSLVLAFTGSATRPADYTVASDTLTLPVGQRSVTTTLTAVDDDLKEPVETTEIAARHAGQEVGRTTLTIAASDAPVLTRAVVASGGRTLTLTFQEPLDTQSPPAAAAFTVTADGVVVRVTAVEITEHTVVLRLAGRVSPGHTVTVSYADPTLGDDADALQTTTGNDADSFTEAAVENQAISSNRTGGGGDGGGGGGGQPEPEPDPDPEPAPEPVGVLENPGPGSRQSGLGLLSGWVCEADVVELEINGTQRVVAAYGTDRADTAQTVTGAELCGDTDNGFGLLFNWNLLGDGVHTVVAQADGVAFDQATFTVTTLGEEFVTEVTGETLLADFPTAGETVRLVWQEAQQNFVLAPPDGAPPPPSPPGPPDGPLGTLENPGPASFQSGIGLLSGWVCEAAVVELEISGIDRTYRLATAYGTDRADTAETEEGAALCGDTDNGFGLVFNWNLLLLHADPPRDAGVFTVRALADGVEFGRATFTVTTLGEEFVEDVTGETLLENFPTPGETVRLVWQEPTQNFVLAPLQ